MFESPPSGYPSGPGVGPGVILDSERARASFPVESMTRLLFGGEHKLARRRQIHTLIESDPVFRRWDNYTMDRQQLYRRGIEKTARYVSLIKDNQITDRDDLYWLKGHIDEQLPIQLHHSMFIPTIEQQGTDEQRDKWLPLANNYNIIGTYAQTELAHGSFVRGLQTTATYNQESDSFIIHTPSLSAAKWWPGNMGKSATHVVLMARLISQGKDYGVHPFIVQIRDLSTHQPLSGVTVGDIGPKFNYEMNDNGFLLFDQFKIPRQNMLMRFASLDKQGRYHPAAHQKLSYGTMVYVRSWIVIEASKTLARALTIAIRYSAVRVQFPVEGAKVGKGGIVKEEQVLNYQTQQYQLFPLLATAFAFHFAGAWMKRLFYKNQANINKGDTSTLKTLHVNSSGLKALTTGVTADAIEVCRKCCGGHGYSKFSGLITLYGDYVPACTYEGDNTVMFLQTARELLHIWNTSRGIKSSNTENNHEKTESVADPLFGHYDKEYDLSSVCVVSSLSGWSSLSACASAFQYRSAALLSSTASRVNQNVLSGVSFSSAFESAKVDLVRCARAHCYSLIMTIFVQAVNDIKDESLKPIINSLCLLFAHSHMEREFGDWTSRGYFNYQQCEWLSESVRELLLVIRADAVPLVDSFEFTDYYLNSALGKYDGNVYECLYKWATTSNPMNQSDIGPGVREVLLPMMKQARQQLKAKL